MAIEPQLILLDEPMAGMNLEEKEDMARYIVDLNEEYGMTVIMIEHDMGVVMDISHRVMVLDFGRKIAEGEPAEVLADAHVRQAYLGEHDALRRASCGRAAARRRAHDRLRRARCPGRYVSQAASPQCARACERQSRCGRRISASGAASPGPIITAACGISRSVWWSLASDAATWSR